MQNVKHIISMKDHNDGGMTVNERLWVSGLMEQFDKAVKKKNRDRVTAILNQVELTGSNVDAVLKLHGLIK